MSGFAPVASAPLASLWPATTAVRVPGRALARDVVRDWFWGVEIVAPTASGAPVPAPFGMVAGLPVATSHLPPDLEAGETSMAFSDRGWIGEPDDPHRPNEAWPARLTEPPALELGIPIYPDESRRAEVTAGELILRNTDSALAGLTGDWLLPGRAVRLYRGPVRSPRRAAAAEISRVAEMRVRTALSGTSRLRLVLSGAGADLSVPACRTYAGTGGEEGGEELAGMPKPRLYGVRRSVSPVQVDAGRLIYQVHDGAMAEVLSVRDGGAPFGGGTLVGSYAALEELVVPEGQYAACLATGHVRLGSTPGRLLTVGARGDVPNGGVYSAAPADIAISLLRGPGGVPAGRSVREAFAWPNDDAGLYVTGGTVADAMERLAAGVGGWWGADAWGSYYGAQALAPEQQGPSVSLEPWAIYPPEEVDASRPPWARVQVGYRGLDTVLTGANLLESVDPGDRAWLSQQQALVTVEAAEVVQRYPAALTAPEVVASVYDTEDAATRLAERLAALLAVPRRAWQVRLRSGVGGVTPHNVWPGQAVAVRWPGIRELAQGRNLIVRSQSARGDDITLTLWG